MDIKFKIGSLDFGFLPTNEDIPAKIDLKLEDIQYEVTGLNILEYVDIMKALPGVVCGVRQAIEEPAGPSSRSEMESYWVDLPMSQIIRTKLETEYGVETINAVIEAFEKKESSVSALESIYKLDSTDIDMIQRYLIPPDSNRF